jgi:pimeloyl-ACP methyl ester carboxylesterase
MLSAAAGSRMVVAGNRRLALASLLSTLVVILAPSPITSLRALAAGGSGASAAAGPSAVDLSVLEPFDCDVTYVAGTSASDVVCGYLTVPEDHFDARNPRQLKLAVAVLPAKGASPRPDPLVYLAGGPGGEVVRSAAAWAGNFFRVDWQERDLVFVDQRGVGQSQPRLDCPEIADFTRAGLAFNADDAAYTDAYFASLRTCIDRLVSSDVNLSAYTSRQSAADIVAISRALGYSQINIYGISYGARLALTLLRDFGSSGYLRSAIIGGTYGPEANPLEVPVNLAERIARVFEQCADDPDCNGAYPNLRARFYAYLAGLESSPQAIMANHGDKDIETMATASTAYYALFDMLFDSVGTRSIPAIVDAAIRGDPALLHLGIEGQTAELQMDWGMNTAVQCQEDLLLVDRQDVEAVARQVPPAMAGWALRFPESSPRLLEFCRGLGLRPLDQRENAAVQSDVPTLAVSGYFDAFAPPVAAAQSVAGLTRGVAFTVGDAGHNSVAANACTRALVTAFLRAPTSAPDGACLAAHARPHFALPFRPEAADPVRITLQLKSNDVITTAVPRSWSATLAGSSGQYFTRGLRFGMWIDKIDAPPPLEDLPRWLTAQGLGDEVQITDETLSIGLYTWRFLIGESKGDGSIRGAVATVGGADYLVLVYGPRPTDDAPDLYRREVLEPALTHFTVMPTAQRSPH